jgi:hypothetical protein
VLDGAFSRLKVDFKLRLQWDNFNLSDPRRSGLPELNLTSASIEKSGGNCHEGAGYRR